MKYLVNLNHLKLDLYKNNMGSNSESFKYLGKLV